MIIIITFGQNNVFGPIHIDTYEFRECLQGLPYVSRLLIIIMEKLHEHDLTENQILHYFLSNYFFPFVNNKKVTNWSFRGALLRFFYEVSIVVLTDIIAILLTPGNFSPL